MIKLLTFLMFAMFALTTDSVGVIIPEIIKEFHLSMTQASAFHYSTMTAIALAGILLGFLADKLGRKHTIVLGLGLYAAACFLFAAGGSFLSFLTLLFLSGVAIGIFKTGALGLIGDLSNSTTEHTTTMNTLEGFFGVGGIIGPLIVTHLLAAGLSWKYLYVIAASVCVALIVIALTARYPPSKAVTDEPVDLARTRNMMKNPYALGFSLGIFFYVACECAILVWMPTLLEGYTGWFALYALSIFFSLRAGGRFAGAWLLSRFEWTASLAVLGSAIFLCFAGSVFGPDGWAVVLLPVSGLFMSVIYPTLNSKGISCFRKSEHGAVAGVILFFTCTAAALGPLAMGLVSDAMGGDSKYGFWLATSFAGLLASGLVFNWVRQPSRALLQSLDEREYAASGQ